MTAKTLHYFTLDFGVDSGNGRVIAEKLNRLRQDFNAMAVRMNEEFFLHETVMPAGGISMIMEASETFRDVAAAHMLVKNVATHVTPQGQTFRSTHGGWRKDMRLTGIALRPQDGNINTLWNDIRALRDKNQMRGDILLRDLDTEKGILRILCPIGFVTTLQMMPKAPVITTDNTLPVPKRPDPKKPKR